MKLQSELTVKDMFPDFGESRMFKKPYDKQEEFIFKNQSVPLKCPCCNGIHTINELKYNSPDGYKPHNDLKLVCPKTNEELEVCTSLFGEGDWLQRKSNIPIA